MTTKKFLFDRYRRKRPKVDVRIFDSVLSHTRRSDASEKRRRKSEENSVSTFGRFRLCTSFESSPVSVKVGLKFSYLKIKDQMGVANFYLSNQIFAHIRTQRSCVLMNF